MSKRIVVDPVTRIEGHLRVEVEVDKGVVVDAWTKGTMFRGIEQIVQGRDPRDAIYIVERICGVCMATHGYTAALGVEDASQAQVPYAAQLIRNLIVGSLWLHDHILHFYHLSALDYLDVLAVKDYRGYDRGLLAVKEKVLKLVQAQDVAPLMPRYQPDEFSVRRPDVVIGLLANYLKALHIQAQAKKMSAILGGKQPHQSSIVVGGVTIYPEAEQLHLFKEILDQVVDFVKTVYVPDAMFVATEHLKPLGVSGFGKGPENFLSYGGFKLNESEDSKLFKGGFAASGSLNSSTPVDVDNITESVSSSWYRQAEPATPFNGETVIDFDKPDAYTFVKSPRYQGMATEVGALARMIVNQDKAFHEVMKKNGFENGAVARHLARAHETVLIADAMNNWLTQLDKLLASSRPNIHDSGSWEPPAYGKGAGMAEAPRGALGHFVEIENQRVKNYQIVVPTTWNVSPRDEQGTRGPIEQALIGTPVEMKNPVNLMRVIRSFDPCMACAVHVTIVDGEQMIQL